MLGDPPLGAPPNKADAMLETPCTTSSRLLLWRAPKSCSVLEMLSRDWIDDTSAIVMPVASITAA
jgi:hypothetical protein